MAAAKKASMSDREADTQIKQMVNFIKQEALEKANEIEVKTDQDYTIEKQMRVQQRLSELREEFRRMEQEEATRHRVMQSQIMGEQERRRLQEQDRLLHSLKDDASGRLSGFAQQNRDGYKRLLTALVAQGMEVLLGRDTGTPEMLVRCLPRDRKVVQSVLENARKEFERKHDKPAPALSMSPHELKDESCFGGVIMTSADNRIVCDNTLARRLDLAFSDMQHVLRSLLFSEDRGRLLVEEARKR